MPVVAIEPDNDDGEQNGHQHTAYDHRSVHPALPLPPRMVRASLAWPVGRAQSCGAPGDERAAATIRLTPCYSRCDPAREAIAAS